MNCPNCGAENEAGVRFCVECGAPMEDLPVDTGLPDEDDDRTILSSMPLISEEAKTVAVGKDDIAAAEAELLSNADTGAGKEQPAAPSAPSTGQPPAEGGSKQKMVIIIAAVLLLLCCCCALVVLGLAMSDTFSDIQYEFNLGWIPVYGWLG